MTMDPAFQLSKAQRREEHLARVLPSLSKTDLVPSRAWMTMFVSISNGKTPSLTLAERHLYRSPSLHPRRLRHGKELLNGLFQAPADRKHRNHVAMPAYFELDVGGRISEFRWDPHGLTISRSEGLGSGHQTNSTSFELRPSARRDGRRTNWQFCALGVTS
jgi:hypothetical protein